MRDAIYHPIHRTLNINIFKECRLVMGIAKLLEKIAHKLKKPSLWKVRSTNGEQHFNSEGCRNERQPLLR